MPNIPAFVLQIRIKRKKPWKTAYMLHPKMPKIPAFVLQIRRKKPWITGYWVVYMSEPQIPKIHAKMSKKCVYYIRNLSGKSTWDRGHIYIGVLVRQNLFCAYIGVKKYTFITIADIFHSTKCSKNAEFSSISRFPPQKFRKNFEICSEFCKDFPSVDN